MGDDDRFDDRDRQFNVNGRIMLIAFVVLFFIVALVVMIHLYGRYLLRRQARRRRSGIQRLTIEISAAQTQTSEPPKRGLEPSVIATLPIFVYRKKDQVDEADECSVCLVAIEENEMARLLPNCKHTFHAQCIDMWFESHSTCPICRTGAKPRPQEEASQPLATAATAPPLEAFNQTASMASEGTSDVARQSSKVGGSGSSRLSSFRRMITRERSDRRTQCSVQVDNTTEDLERR